MTSYKVMVSNDSHTWVTVKNGSGDMVSLFFPPPGCLAVWAPQGQAVGAQRVLAPERLLISGQLKPTSESQGEQPPPSVPGSTAPRGLH